MLPMMQWIKGLARPDSSAGFCCVVNDCEGMCDLGRIMALWMFFLVFLPSMLSCCFAIFSMCFVPCVCGMYWILKSLGKGFDVSVSD